MRILIEGGLDLDLRQLLADAVGVQPLEVDTQSLGAELLTFHLDRLRGYYADQGFAPELFAATAANGLRRPLDFHRRIAALRQFVQQDSAARICAAHKRVRNILKGGGMAPQVSVALFSEAAETALHAAMGSIQGEMLAHCERGEYTAALTRLIDLAEPVDRFFDQVRVMSQDAARRANRLALLAALDLLFRSVADISCLSPTDDAT